MKIDPAVFCKDFLLAGKVLCAETHHGRLFDMGNGAYMGVHAVARARKAGLPCHLLSSNLFQTCCLEIAAHRGEGAACIDCSAPSCGACFQTECFRFSCDFFVTGKDGYTEKTAPSACGFAPFCSPADGAFSCDQLCAFMGQVYAVAELSPYPLHRDLRCPEILPFEPVREALHLPLRAGAAERYTKPVRDKFGSMFPKIPSKRRPS